MVCQAASKTRFRTLKHENGVAGFSTIIVRLIVCFQPLDECQVCPFLFKFFDLILCFDIVFSLHKLSCEIVS
ncbi:hypothetical protein RND81_01G220400 [Saponaria officinalis]|uniref:Uncharacterized protein n=1 Tax=Saponaria officinalis TaxID=3572 RepID=A0AAW1NHM3_SAPOF